MNAFLNIKSLLTGIVFILSLTSWSQEETEKESFLKKVRFGGGMQLSIGSGHTTIGVSPSAIYEISDKFSAGIGVSYLYSKNKLYDIKYNVYGASALALYNPIRGIQLSAEFEELSVNRKNYGETDSYWLPALYVGAAYSMSRNVAIGIRYDVLYDDKNENENIYDSAFTPFVRVYF